MVFILNLDKVSLKLEYSILKTGVHGALEVTPLAWKFNSKQLLSKTLYKYSTNRRKWASEAKREDLELEIRNMKI